MKKIDAHALRAFPDECVGLLVGTSSKEGFEVRKAVAAVNTKPSPVGFEADPQFVYKVHKDAEAQGLQLVGIYHSHPDMRSFVSSRDAEFMKYWGQLAWLILGLSRDEVLERKAFTMRDKKIREIEVVVSA